MAHILYWFTQLTRTARCGSGANGCNKPMGYGFVIFMGISYIYTSITVGNVAVVTLAGGPFGCEHGCLGLLDRLQCLTGLTGWYYFGSRTSHQMPRWPAASAFGRAATSSLGSIAFGSLIVTILEIIKGLLHSASNDSNGERVFRHRCPYFVSLTDNMIQADSRSSPALPSAV